MFGCVGELQLHLLHQLPEGGPPVGVCLPAGVHHHVPVTQGHIQASPQYKTTTTATTTATTVTTGGSNVGIHLLAGADNHVPAPQ